MISHLNIGIKVYYCLIMLGILYSFKGEMDVYM